MYPPNSVKNEPTTTPQKVAGTAESVAISQVRVRSSSSIPGRLPHHARTVMAVQLGHHQHVAPTQRGAQRGQHGPPQRWLRIPPCC